MSGTGTTLPPFAAEIIAAAEALVDAEIADELALGELLDAEGPEENERCRDRQKVTARERDEALIALAAFCGKRWPPR